MKSTYQLLLFVCCPIGEHLYYDSTLDFYILFKDIDLEIFKETLKKLRHCGDSNYSIDKLYDQRKLFIEHIREKGLPQKKRSKKNPK